MKHAAAEAVTPIQCTTEQFWTEMCRLRFVRTSLHTGVVGDAQFCCAAPPELVPGFLERKARETVQLLAPSRYELACFDAAVAGLPPPPKPWTVRLWEWIWEKQ